MVEGDTLADRLNRGPIPVEESLKLALQIADALKAAHDKGVIHRDLKPLNIKVTDDDNVKVLDFGLAKAFAGEQDEVAAFNSPTLSMAATQQGMILGTAAYMSPEQAKGRAVDKRADVWAFGCVLYEMLTGRQSFGASDVTESLAAVISLQPKWDMLPTNLHPRLQETVERCLEKRVVKRFQDIGDVSVDIEKVLADPSGVLVQTVSEVVQAAPQSKLPWVAAIALTAIVAGLGVWVATQPEPPALARLTITHRGAESIGTQFDPDVAISPDGRSVAYVAASGANGGELYLRELGQREPRLLTDNARLPFFSPDGEWVGFVDDDARVLNKVTINGGPAVVIGNLPAPSNPRGATWGSDDNIIFAVTPGGANLVSNDTAIGLWRIPAGGGEAEMLTTPDVDEGEGHHVFPEILPGGLGGTVHHLWHGWLD